MKEQEGGGEGTERDSNGRLVGIGRDWVGLRAKTVPAL